LEAPGRTLSEYLSYGSETFARPLTSLAKQLAHRLLGSPEMAAALSMRRSMLSVASSAQSEQGSTFTNWLSASAWPLFEILRGNQPASKEQVNFSFLCLHVLECRGSISVKNGSIKTSCMSSPVACKGQIRK